MKLFISIFILFSFCSLIFGQKQIDTSCDLQEVAINAALGDVDAKYDLGVMFFRKKDYSKVAVMWRLASEGGNIVAFNNLGYLTYYGKGVMPNYAEGIRLWRIAAEKGEAESQIHLADAYLDDVYLKPDNLEAYAWAKSGKHFAGQVKDEGLKKSLLKMAEETLVRAKKGLSAAQVTAAEKKAAEYIAKFAQK